MRFSELLDESLSLGEIRGKEGIRVRQAYAAASRDSGVEWKGRSYSAQRWSAADPTNRALSAANSCLYGVCHAAIIASGFSPALGFIHTGKMLSFVFDVADLYKTELTIPVAFATVAEGTTDLETRVRRRCRDLFSERKLLARIVPDIEHALDASSVPEEPELMDVDADGATPGGLWDPESGRVRGGVSYRVRPEEDEQVGRHDP
jgi:CRISPR-associated protein Cas1